jgi:SAM-dependent methyltransferase
MALMASPWRCQRLFRANAVLGFEMSDDRFNSGASAHLVLDREAGLERFYTGAESLFVRAYDAFYADGVPPIAGDIAFYDRLVRATGGPVLELGCGTGRIALALARGGFSVTGVDVSVGMLALARRKSERLAAAASRCLTFVEGDMARLDLGRRFGMAVIAFRSFQHLLTVDEQRATLTGVRRHLRPGGRLALHLFDPRFDLLAENAPAIRQSGIDPATQRRYAGEILRTGRDYLKQIRRDLWRYTETDLNGVLLDEATREMALRWTYRWELQYLLELCGFVVEAEYSDFHGAPPAYGKELIVIARRETNPRKRVDGPRPSS